MTSGRQLKGRRIAVLAADGFEKVELSVPDAAAVAAHGGNDRRRPRLLRGQEPSQARPAGTLACRSRAEVKHRMSVGRQSRPGPIAADVQWAARLSRPPRAGAL